mmetsp:Transcript_4213/g.17050  ORF Transcript_4213/g.17050 Transcript_4213/m.17050 type:complete len:107 (-) Transcript_4213:48-368(-)
MVGPLLGNADCEANPANFPPPQGPSVLLESADVALVGCFNLEKPTIAHIVNSELTDLNDGLACRFTNFTDLLPEPNVTFPDNFTQNPTPSDPGARTVEPLSRRILR